MEKLVKGFCIVMVSVLCVAGFATAQELTPELCKQKAIAAAELLKAQGAAAFDAIKDPNGAFRFADGKGYVWVHNLEGIMVMHPIKPALDGQSVQDMKDVNGRYLFTAMNDLVEAEASGQGWVPYHWPKPGEDVPSAKISYVVLAKHGDEEFVAGAGMYDVTEDDIRAAYPNDPVYNDDDY